MINLEVNLDGIVEMMLAMMFGPAIILALIGFVLQKRNKKAAKVFFILAVTYVIVSLGVCGVLMTQ
ncbi:hypothetical protein [Olleya aquimaris]|uniref:Uncharacterized protein n=1 Tax=Olleya aquimaris TaxID=639310 RepID=A0A327RQI7_9FLAO|nr:hypothetical protein [Olleya aquimaris]RAJ17843.1 hypothetical protein LY08_00112 [Olleya aquimaris]